MNDEELKDLFSAFDDVSASDSLKDSTLDFIMGAAAASGATSAEAAPEQAPVVKATRGGKGVRAKWRAMRMAALAACLALALTGGVAYAYPASTVLVTQGETTVELQVNVFGQVLSASASDDATQELIDQMGLVHTSYEDSVSRVSDTLKESNPEVPIEVVLNGVTQTPESEDEADAPQDEKPSGGSSGSFAAGDSAVLKVDLPAAESESAAPTVVAAPDIVIALPEPAGVTAAEEEEEKPGNGNGRSSSREATHPIAEPEEVVPVVIDDGGSAVEPAQPAVVAEEPSEAPENPQPAGDSGNDPAPGAEADEEPVSEPTRLPQNYGDDED